MKITKLGHCCLLIEDRGKVIMTDPGAWTDAQDEITGIDIVLITHEHPDHFHIESVKKVLANNPRAVIVTNSRVNELLAEQAIAAIVIEHEQHKDFSGIAVAGFGTQHAVIYPTIPPVMNTGYLIQNRFFYPGDAFIHPGVAVEIAAMPMIGPWMKLAEAIDWVIELKPRICIPVHDGMLNPRQWIYGLPSKLLPAAGIQFNALEPGEPVDYT